MEITWKFYESVRIDVDKSWSFYRRQTSVMRDSYHSKLWLPLSDDLAVSMELIVERFTSISISIVDSSF